VFLTGEVLVADDRRSKLRLSAINLTDMAVVACLQMALYASVRSIVRSRFGVKSFEQLKSNGRLMSLSRRIERDCRQR
jgi:hypothetical protein